MLTLTYEHPYSEDNLERKFQAKISPYNIFFEKPKEELIDFKGNQQMEPKKLSSEHITDDVLNLTSKNPSSEDNFERKFQANLSPSNQNFEQVCGFTFKIH